MKKYKFYVCSRYVFYFYASLLAVILMWVILMLFSKNVEIMIYCFITVSIISVHYFFLARGSFSRVYITGEGIGNKYLFFAWTEIASYHLCEIKHPLGLTFPTQFFPMIVCIGDVSSNIFFIAVPKKQFVFR